MKTLADIVNAPKKAEISLEKCVIVKIQEDGTYNVSCEINGNKEFVNYVDINKLKDNKLYVAFGKKEESWKKARWYQIEPSETEEEEEKKMFNFLHTLAAAAEHSTVRKVFGSYKNAALVEGNLNLLHKLQDEALCNSHFIEPDEQHITLDMLFKSNSSNTTEVDMTGEKPA